MSYRPQPYDDADPTATMLVDARRAALVVPVRPATPARPVHADKLKQPISVDQVALRLARALDS